MLHSGCALAVTLFLTLHTHTHTTVCKHTYAYTCIWCMHIEIYGLIATASASASGWPWAMPCTPSSFSSCDLRACNFDFMIACLCVRLCVSCFFALSSSGNATKGAEIGSSLALRFCCISICERCNTAPSPCPSASPFSQFRWHLVYPPGRQTDTETEVQTERQWSKQKDTQAVCFSQRLIYSLTPNTCICTRTHWHTYIHRSVYIPFVCACVCVLVCEIEVKTTSRRSSDRRRRRRRET